ncbi:MAG: aldehyde ferredoxin oxidoreductase family protein [Thermoprotei archaeon]|nr:aldehyde ferredoxin oxidoreductase family protein [Thermoprotei archaeon]
MYGYAGRIVVADAATKSFKVLDVDESLAKTYIGGKGLANKILYDYGIWGYDALDPGNPLIFASGPFGGTRIPMASRAWSAFRSPLTGILGGSNLGGSLAAVMKYAGVDVLIVRGASRDPLYIVVEDGSVEFRDASHLWGLDAISVEEELKKDHGRDSAVLAIGPAGENLVRFASINHDVWRQFGRTGAGAVMGSKRVKAIVFKPAGRDVPLADPGRLSEYLKSFTVKLLGEATTKALRDGGTPRIVEIANRMGFFPSYYWSKVQVEGWGRIEWSSMKKDYFVKAGACLYCSVACHRLVESRKFNVRVDIEYETIFALGGLPGVSDPDWLIKLNDLADRLGMDTITLGNMIGFTIELSRRGIVDYKIDWGEPEKIEKLTVDIAYRRGLGEILAEGVARAAKALGAEELAVHVKNLEPAGYDPRTLKGMALGYAISGRGADHLGTMAYAIDIAGRAGGRLSLAEEKVKAVIEYENLGALMDSLLLCKFGRYIYNFQNMAELLNIVTGWEYTPEQIVETAERIVTLTRMINNKMGVDRSKDQLPKKFYEPIEFEGKEYKLTGEEVEKALDAYYDIRGWDKNGVPTLETAERLKIEKVKAPDII